MSPIEIQSMGMFEPPFKDELFYNSWVLRFSYLSIMLYVWS